jgi:signal transduction histidine kinase
LGLVPAIRQQAAKQGRLADDHLASKGSVDSGPIFFVEALQKLPPLAAAVEVACYCIAQEAINNVVRHAWAHNCRVRISIDEARKVLELDVIDDGVGIPEGRRAGVGSSSMRERAEELGGTLVVEPNPKGGTRVLARLPLFAVGEE